MTLDGMALIPPHEAQELAGAKDRVHVRPVRGLLVTPPGPGCVMLFSNWPFLSIL